MWLCAGTRDEYVQGLRIGVCQSRVSGMLGLEVGRAETVRSHTECWAESGTSGPAVTGWSGLSLWEKGQR